MKPLKGQALADAYADNYRRHIEKESGQDATGKVWAIYEGGGWITLRGEGVPASRKMQKQYPNGWSLMDRIRSGEARLKLRAAHAR